MVGSANQGWIGKESAGEIADNLRRARAERLLASQSIPSASVWVTTKLQGASYAEQAKHRFFPRHLGRWFMFLEIDPYAAGGGS
jgi:hypothetical protein